MAIESKQCKKCSYRWTPRIDNPTVCPKCKSYKWDSDTDGRRNNLNLADEDDPFQPTAFDERGNPLVYSEDDFN